MTLSLGNPKPWLHSVPGYDTGTCLVAQLCQTFCDTMDCIACQVPLSMGFPRQEYWSGLPFLSPGDLPNSGIKSMSPKVAGRFFTPEPPGKPKINLIHFI